MLESESHAVRSHADCPGRAAPVYETSPRPSPVTVTLYEPLVAPFTLNIVLKLDLSDEKPSLSLPGRPPTLSDTLILPFDPSPVWHRIDVSDSQEVLSHPECPNRTAPLHTPSPKFDPCNVTLLEPVVARLACLTRLNAGTSTELGDVWVPLCSPTVTLVLRLPVSPCETCPRTDVSDSQVVCSTPVSPLPIQDEKDTSPKPEPPSADPPLE